MAHKILFAGPVGAGKTTAISTISDIPVVATEARATDDTQLIKSHTTVAMDYGILNLEGGTKIHLYGTPGQERFSFMWDIATAGGIGLVLLSDNSRPDPLADLTFYLEAFAGFIARTAVVIGVNRMEGYPEPRLSAYQERLESLNLHVPVFEVDPRSRADMKTLLLALLATLDPGLDR